MVGNEKIDINQIKKFIQEIFLSDYFRELFEANFPKEIYSRIKIQMDFKTFFLPENIYSALAMVKIINDINSPETYETTFDWLNSIPLDRTDETANNSVVPDKFRKMVNLAKVSLRYLKTKL